MINADMSIEKRSWQFSLLEINEDKIRTCGCYGYMRVTQLDSKRALAMLQTNSGYMDVETRKSTSYSFCRTGLLPLEAEHEDGLLCSTV